MQFTRFPGRCPAGGTTHGVYLLHAEFLAFHSAFVFLLKERLDRQEEDFPVCSVHIPSEIFPESLLDFFGAKQFLA
jgi:hypothetical protein